MAEIGGGCGGEEGEHLKMLITFLKYCGLFCDDPEENINNEDLVNNIFS